MVWEDDKALAFRDIAPTAPTHIVLIPKVRDTLTGIDCAEERHISILGHLMVAARKIADQEKLDNGWRLVINNGPDGC